MLNTADTTRLDLIPGERPELRGTARSPVRQTVFQSLGAALVGVLTVALLPGTFAPTFFPNEDVYLSLLFQHAGHSPLAADWTLSHLPPDRRLFDVLFAPLAAWADPTLVAQIGRPLAWLTFLAAVLIFLRGLGLRNPLAAMTVVLLWLVPFPFSVSQEWILGALEAKTFAWAALLAMLAAVGRNRVWLGALLTIAAVSLHFSLGVWTCVFFGATVAVTSVSWRRKLGALGLGAVGALLAAVPMLRFVANNPAQSDADIRGWSRGLWSIHHDPFQFPPILMIGFAMVCFGSNLLHARTSRDRRTTPWRVLRRAELVGVALFALGVLARAADADSVLISMPFRAGPPIIALGALVRAVDCFGFIRASDPPAAPLLSVTGSVRQVGVVGLIGLLFVGAGHFGPAVKMWRYRTTIVKSSFRPARTSEVLAAEWSSRNLPPEAVVAINPAQAYFGEVDRKLVASLRTARMDDLPGWNTRITALSGVDVTTLTGFVAVSDAVGLGYDTRPFSVVQGWPEQFGVTHIISPADYPLPVLATFGDVKVYEIGATSKPPSVVTFD